MPMRSESPGEGVVFDNLPATGVNHYKYRQHLLHSFSSYSAIVRNVWSSRRVDNDWNAANSALRSSFSSSALFLEWPLFFSQRMSLSCPKNSPEALRASVRPSV